MSTMFNIQVSPDEARIVLRALDHFADHGDRSTVDNDVAVNLIDYIENETGLRA